MKYHLTLVFEDRVERIRGFDGVPRTIGDELEAQGKRWEVIGILWLDDEERLLCRPLKDADHGVTRERAWWSTEWQ